MGNDVSQEEFEFVCFRCGRIIKPTERMVTLSVSLESPTEDGCIECIENCAVSSLCFPCTSVLISRAIVSDSQLIMPTRETAEEEAEYRDGKTTVHILINSIPDDSKVVSTAMEVRCSEKGFYYTR